MAKKKAEKPEETKEQKNNKKMVVRVRDRFKIMVEADQENRRLALEDLKFLHVPGEQWDEVTKKERGKDRPCYEFNKLRVTVKRIVNDMRANRPQGKVRAVEDGDKDTADVFEGLARNIWNVSDGDTIIDYAAEYQVGAGMGAWRVNTKYSTDTAFDQEIVIEPIKNPFTLYADPAAADPIKRDAEDWILTERISNSSYKRRWPNAEKVNFDDTEFDDDSEWSDDETTRICEYWYKEPATKTLLLLADGKTVDASKFDGDATQIKRRREIKCHKVMMCIVSGDAVLEGPSEWAGTEFPFVQVYGDWLVIDGKVYWYGLTRHSKGAQMSYNYTRTAITETIALAPQSKYWATVDQAKGHTDQWAEAHKKLFPFQLYNADGKAPGPPVRLGGPDVPVALMQEAQISSEEIKATSGIFDNSLGQQGNETSGRAIAQRQRQGEIATYNYQDNNGKGVRRTWEILIDLIPKIYDTERSVRILGVDGAEKYVRINQPEQDPKTGKMKVNNDLTTGKYDVAVTVGPSFSTQRQEATELYTQLGTAVPAVWTVAGDLIFKSMDLPYAEQIAERMKALLPPQIQKTLQEGKQLPPEVQQAMQQVEQAMQAVQEHGKLVQAAEQELKEMEASAKSAQGDLKLQKVELDAQRSQIDLAKAALDLAKKDLQLEQEKLAAAQDEIRKDFEIAQLKIKNAHATAEHNLKQQAHQQDMKAKDMEHKQREFTTKLDGEIRELMHRDAE